MTPTRDQITGLLRERIVGQIRAGTLEYGDRLPSARELSTELDADPRTILAAYHALAEEDLVELRRRSGVFVAARLSAARPLVAAPARWLVEVLADGIERDIRASDLASRLTAATTIVPTRALVLECNRDQIHSMCRELSEDYGLIADGMELTDVERSAEGIARLNAADLIVSAAHADTVRSIADRVGVPCIITSVRPDLVQRTMRLLARGPVYFVVTDARFAEKLRHLFAPVPGGDNFRTVVLGRDDVRDIPADASTYVMRLAAECLRGKTVPGRVVAPLRIFSSTCAREILDVIVRRNLGAQRD